jgi:hypothetical protein
MPTSEEYRNLAAETRVLAGQTRDEHERDALLRISAQWELLADYKAAREAGSSKKLKPESN